MQHNSTSREGMSAYSAQGTMATRASNAYKASTFEGLNQHELMLEATRVMLQKLHLGRDAYRIKRLDEMTGHHEKIFSILALLVQTLDQIIAGADGETQLVCNQFKSFYRSINDRIVYILSKPSIEDEYAALINELTLFYRLWQPKPANTNAAPATEPAAPISLGNIKV